MKKLTKTTTCLCCNSRKAEANDSLCERCFDEAGEINSHYDGFHDETASDECPICLNGNEDCINQVKARKTRQVTIVQGAGQVTNPKTDRRLAANKGLAPRTASQRRADRKAARQ